MNVTAIVPVYNAESTLKRAIDSLLIQDEINEILLVEDGSSDNSLQLCKTLEEEFEDITVLTHPRNENRGAPASRNLGVAHSSNEWIQFLDADDELLPNKVSLQLELVEEDTALVLGGFNFNSGEEKWSKAPLKDVWAGLIATSLGNTIANLWNASLIKKAGGWNESLPNVQEYYLMFEILKLNENVKICNTPLVNVYSQPNSITNSRDKAEEKKNTYFRFRHDIRNFLLQEGRFNFLRRHYYHVCTGGMLSYHQPPFEVELNHHYFNLYQKLRALKRMFLG